MRMILSFHFTFFSLPSSPWGRTNTGRRRRCCGCRGKGLPEVGRIWPGRGGGAREGGAQGRGGGAAARGWGGAKGRGGGGGLGFGEKRLPPPLAGHYWALAHHGCPLLGFEAAPPWPTRRPFGPAGQRPRPKTRKSDDSSEISLLRNRIRISFFLNEKWDITFCPP